MVFKCGQRDLLGRHLRVAYRKEARARTAYIHGADVVVSLAEKKGMSDEMDLIELVEKLTPEVFAEKKGSDKPMCANVDMYSGFVYRMLGLPKSLYTPLFATARIVGWMAHRLEEVTTGGKIIRPAYKPLAKATTYTNIDERM